MTQSESLAGAGRFDPTRSVPLGHTSLEVTQMAVGTVPLSGLFHRMSQADARAVLDAAWSSGVRFFDLAPLYGYGFAERVTGEMLREHDRGSFVLSTKVGRLIRTDGPAEREDRSVLYQGHPRFAGTGAERPYFDFTYDGVMRSLEESRERTGIERFDVLHIHDPDDLLDEATEGAYRALQELRDAGEVSAIGVGSNSWQAHLEMTRRGDFDCLLLAGRYTLLDQSALPELLPACETKGIAVIAAGVFNSGILSHPDPGSIGTISHDPADMGTWKDSLTFDYVPATAEVIAKAGRIKAVCDRHAVPLVAAAVQFPLHHPAVPCVLIGPRTPAHVAANDAAMRFPIPDALWAELKAEGLLPEEAPTP